MKTTTITALTGLKAKWQAINPREQALVLAASALVLLALVWSTGVAPPLRVLRQATDQQRTLDAETQNLQNLQAQAQRLQALPKTSRDDALRAIQTATKPLGAAAQLDVSAERVTLTLRAVPADALAQWLAQVRATAHAQPTEVRLSRADSPVAAWDGIVVLGLPAK
jgi:general secretion pathway protein M